MERSPALSANVADETLVYADPGHNDQSVASSASATDLKAYLPKAIASGGCGVAQIGSHPAAAAAMGPVGGPAPSPSPSPHGAHPGGTAPPPLPPPGAMAQVQVGVLGPPGGPPPQVMAMAPPVDENYCLRWNEYEKKYAEQFRVLRDDEYFTDVTLATEDHSVKAHRVILSACSNYFHAILKTMSPWQHPVLLLQDVKSADLNSLMDFMYFGQASVTRDSLQSFLKVAQKLKIKGLCETLAPSPVSLPADPGVHSHVGHAPPPPVMAPPPPTHARLTPQSNQSAAMSPHPQVLPQGPPSLPNSAAGPLPPPPPSVNANFEGLLPRSPYVPEPSIVPLCGGQTVSAPPSIAVARPPISTAPPVAHQSPRQITRGSVPPRPASEAVIHYSTPKRPKYATTQSILRNQLSQIKDGVSMAAQGTGGAVHVAVSGATGHPNNGGNEIEVKSEPMAILAAHEPEVPSSAVSVTEFISTHNDDLTLTTLGHGISPQFIFSPDPAAENAGGGVPVSVAGGAAGAPPSAAAPPPPPPGTGGVPPPGGPATSQAPPPPPPPPEHVIGHASVVPAPGALVTIDDKTVRLGPDTGQVGGPGGGAAGLPPHSAPSGPVVAVSGAGPNNGAPVTPTHLHAAAVAAAAGPGGHHLHGHLHAPPPPPAAAAAAAAAPLPPHLADEPQDLTPGPGQDSPSPAGANNGGGPTVASLQQAGTPTSSANNSLVGSPSATPPKKDRNSRKTCGYCHKDFHEMSLKRHIKDVHFRNQNTYVICPQCCKQYASQNSLYSHLNRVHGVKKDVIQNMELQLVQGPSGGGGVPTPGPPAGSGPGGPAAAPAPGGNGAAQQPHTPGSAAPPPPGHAPNSSNNSSNSSQQQGGSSGAQTPTGDNHHDGIMDLAHHSDNSN